MDERGSRQRRPVDARVWDTVPWLVRTVVVWSGCFIVVAAALYLLGRLAVQLAPLALALAVTVFLAALLEPLRATLRWLHCPRALTALLAILAMLTVLVLPLTLTWRRGAGQFSRLSAELTDGLRRLRSLITGPGSPISEQQLDDIVGQLSIRLRQLLPSPVAGARAAGEVVGAMLLVLVLLFFALKDGHGMWTWLLRRVPERSRTLTAHAGDAAWGTLTGYARGTLIVALVDAVGIGTALVVLDVPLALSLTLLTFFGAFIPIIGATVAGSLAVLVALATRGPGTALLVAASVIAVQQIEGNLLHPVVMKRQVKLHPAVILVAITAGTLLGGIAGAFVAVPLTAVTYRVLTVMQRQRADDGRVRPDDTEPATAPSDKRTEKTR